MSFERADIRLKISQEAVEKQLGHYIDAKQEAIRDVFKFIGSYYKRELSRILPSSGFGNLDSSYFRMRTMIDKGGSVTMFAGLLNKNDYAISQDFLRFWLYGTERHWVSLKAHPEMSRWAVRNGIVSDLGDGKYSYNDGTRAYAIESKVKSHYKEVIAIQNEVKKELIYRLERM